MVPDPNKKRGTTVAFPQLGKSRWRQIEFDPAAQRELGKLDPQTACRILAFLDNSVAKLDDPRSIGEALKGSELGTFWKYRVGNYRIIASIEDGALRILVARIGNRKQVYRK